VSAQPSGGEGPILRAALRYAARGWQVLPVWGIRDDLSCACGAPECRNAGKHPLSTLVPHGLKDASSDPERIREWWDAHPDANIGIATGRRSGVVVVDLDDGGEKSLARLEAKRGALPLTLEATTGRGRHLYFRAPEGELRSRTHAFPGIDIRAEGGYVVAPPSRHAAGRRYQWVCADVEPAEMPAWLVARLSGGPPTAQAEPPQATADPWSEELATKLAAALTYLDADPYAPWIRFGAALFHASGGSEAGLELWDTWSATAPRSYRPGECARRWPTFGGYTGEIANAQTIFSAARAVGWLPPRPPPPMFQRGDQQEIAERLLADFEQDGPVRLVADRGSLWSWNGQHWERIAPEFGRNLIGGYAGALIETGIDAQQEPKSRVLRIDQPVRKGAWTIAVEQRSRPGFFDEARAGLAFSNGFLTIGEEGHRMLPLSPDQRATAAFPWPWYGEAPGPLWTNALTAWFRDATDPEATIKCVQEFAGACLLGIATRYQCAMILTGSGGNGKSEFLKVISAMFPPETVTAVAPQSMKDDKKRAHLVGARLNIVTEMPESEIIESGPFKAAVTGDLIDAREVYGLAFSFRPVAGHMFAANVLPPTRDQSRAFWRRWRMVPFDRAFDLEPGERIKDLAQQIIATELNGVVSWAVDGACRLQAQGDYTRSRDQDAAMARWKRDTDPVSAWLDDRADRDGCTPAGELFEDYRAFCNDLELTHGSTTHFGKRLRALGVREIRQAQARCWALRLRGE
jgi:putative DNA primase/helicase